MSKQLDYPYKRAKTIKDYAYRWGFENLVISLINRVAALTGLSHKNPYKKMHGRLISPGQEKDPEKVTEIIMRRPLGGGSTLSISRLYVAVNPFSGYHLSLN